MFAKESGKALPFSKGGLLLVIALPVLSYVSYSALRITFQKTYSALEEQCLTFQCFAHSTFHPNIFSKYIPPVDRDPSGDSDIVTVM